MITVNKTEYLDEQGLNELWNKIKEYVAENGGGGEGQDGFSPIATVTQTSTGAIITITDKNGTTSATITNGEDGQDGTNGTNGTDGEDGFSPTIVENSGNNSTTYKLDITTKTSTFTTPNLKGQDGTGGDVDLSNYYTKSETYSKTEIDDMLPEDGYSPTATVTQTETGATISITDKTGTTTATITNGTNGQDGADGEDGFSPTIVENANNNDTTYKLDITTKDSTFTTPNLKGADGTGGGGSGSGFNPFDYSNTNEVAVGTWVDGKTIYRKYFTWTVETNQTNFPQDIPHNIENLEATVLIEGFIKYGTTCIPINSMTLNQVYSGSNLTVSKFNEWLQGNFRIQLTDTLIRIGPTNKGGYTAYMFVYYTKSS